MTPQRQAESLSLARVTSDRYEPAGCQDYRTIMSAGAVVPSTSVQGAFIAALIDSDH